jgi:hypothetical protein
VALPSNPTPEVDCLECGFKRIPYSVGNCPNCGHPICEAITSVFVELEVPYKTGTESGPTWCILQIPLKEIERLCKLSFGIRADKRYCNISIDDIANSTWMCRSLWSDQFDYCGIDDSLLLGGEIPEESFRSKAILEKYGDEENAQVSGCSLEISQYGIWWKATWDSPASFETTEFGIGMLLEAAFHAIHRIPMERREFLKWHRKLTKLGKRVKIRY